MLVEWCGTGDLDWTTRSPAVVQSSDATHSDDGFDDSDNFDDEDFDDDFDDDFEEEFEDEYDIKDDFDHLDEPDKKVGDSNSDANKNKDEKPKNSANEAAD